MSDLSDRLIEAGPVYAPQAGKRAAYPDGWQPRSEVDTATGGYVVSKPYEPGHEPDHEAALKEFDLDPAQWAVTSVRRSRWQKYDESWLESVRINLVPTHRVPSDAADTDAMMAAIMAWKPNSKKAKKVQGGVGSFVCPSGDLQLGKGGEAGGSGAIIDRFLEHTDRSVTRLTRGLGDTIAPQVVLPWLGDCIEGVVSQGGRLVMRLDLTPTQQVRAYRRLMWAQIRAYLPKAEKIIIPVIPGNHDQAHRMGDQMATYHDDSWAIDGASAVMDGINEHPELKDRVSFLFPGHDELTVLLDVSGTNIAMTHGHIFGRDPLKWWDSQCGGRQPVGEADVLLAAHSHHLRIQDHGGGRLFMQIPAMDNGSNWFRHRYGAESPSRLLSFWTSDGSIRDLDPVL